MLTKKFSERTLVEKINIVFFAWHARLYFDYFLTIVQLALLLGIDWGWGWPYYKLEKENERKEKRFTT